MVDNSSLFSLVQNSFEYKHYGLHALHFIHTTGNFWATFQVEGKYIIRLDYKDSLYTVRGMCGEYCLLGAYKNTCTVQEALEYVRYLLVNRVEKLFEAKKFVPATLVW